MSADEFRLLLVRWFLNAAALTAVVLEWPHLEWWLYALIGAAIFLINPYNQFRTQARGRPRSREGKENDRMTDPLHAQNTDNGRYYFHPVDSRGVPSITNIKGLKNFKAAKSVAAKDCATYVSKNIATLATLGEQEIWSLVKESPWRKDTDSNIASHNGDVVHQWIDLRINGGKINPDVYVDTETGEEKPSSTTAKAMWRSFLDFEKYYKPEWVRSEFTVWNDNCWLRGNDGLGCQDQQDARAGR